MFDDKIRLDLGLRGKAAGDGYIGARYGRHEEKHGEKGTEEQRKFSVVRYGSENISKNPGHQDPETKENGDVKKQIRDFFMRQGFNKNTEPYHQTKYGHRKSATKDPDAQKPECRGQDDT
jgi:hypothetical protein